jgi:hypothetical protein
MLTALFSDFRIPTSEFSMPYALCPMLSVTGYWVLDAGCWILDAGYRLSAIIYWLQDYIDFTRGWKPLPQLTDNN